VLEAQLAAALAAAAPMPALKSKPLPASALDTVELARVRAIDLERSRSIAAGNHLARWLTTLPPNVLDCLRYRAALRTLAEREGWSFRFHGEPALRRLGAGAFLAVSQANDHRGAGIVQLGYRPRGVRARQHVGLVGKGICFDTGGHNLKTARYMHGMHEDMNGSAVALGILLAASDARLPVNLDCWMALARNELSPRAYRQNEVVTALNGTTIEIVHTDAEGRMVLADTLALAAREKPAVMIDYATLTGSCEIALTQRYSGVFANRTAANELLHRAGVDSGERVWPFPMDDDYDELLKSDVADIKQCSAESAGDHILGARFLSRFVPKSIPWVHVDLSAGQHKGGLGHVPTEITGFGVRLTVELLTRTTSGAGDLRKRLDA
jgi:leucyl aminopeptidase